MPESIADIVKQIMGDILDVDLRLIDDDTSMEKMASWDSANHINLVLAIEEEFGVSFDVTEIESMISFYDIVTAIEQKT